jgi:hypothetical protein
MEVNKKYRLFEEIDVTTLMIGVESHDSTPINICFDFYFVY